MPERKCWTVLTRALVDGVIVAWVGEEGRPVVWDTAEEAQAEIDEGIAEAREQVARGERDEGDDGPCSEDWVAECVLYDDGSLSVPSLSYEWSLAEIRKQRGME